VDEAARKRRRLLLALLALEILLFSGPFLLAWLYVEWHAWRGLPPPQRVPFMLPMMATGMALAVAWMLFDALHWLRRQWHRWRRRR